MARPATIADIKAEYTKIEIATVQMDQFSSDPQRIKAYSDFINALAKLGATMDVSYNTVRIRVPKNQEQLEDQLRLDQGEWDRNQANYEQALRAEFVEKWRQHSIREWAKSEGLREPVFVEKIEDEELENA